MTRGTLGVVVALVLVVGAVAWAPATAGVQSGSSDAVVSGRITANGRPAPDSCVRWHGATQTVTTSTDDDGRYTLGLTPGEPGKLEACRSLVGDSGTWAFDGPYAAMWYGGASSRATATFLTLDPGSTMSWDVDLPRYDTLAIVVTSLPSADGCFVRVVDGRPGDVLVQLRPSVLDGVWLGDVFDVAGGAPMTLECDGEVLGLSRNADSRTPFVYPGTGPDDPFSPIVEIEVDRTGPVIAVHGRPTSWTNNDVVVRFTCEDAISSASCPVPQAFSEGDRRKVTSTDWLGNVSTLTVGPLRIDRTRPRLTVTTSRRRFHIDDRIHLGCRVSDARSGLRRRANTCPADGTRAADIGAGEHTFYLLGEDRAGNTAGRAVAIEIVK